MSSKSLGNLMKIFVLAATAFGLFLCLFVVPTLGNSVIKSNSEFSGWFWPWLVFAWLFSLPCFAILIYIWKVAGAVVCDTVFTTKTAKWVKIGSVLMLCNAVLLFVGNILLGLLNMNHPGMLLLSVIGTLFMLALAVLAAVLSRYLTKAAILQEECEGTL